MDGLFLVHQVAFVAYMPKVAHGVVRTVEDPDVRHTLQLPASACDHNGTGWPRASFPQRATSMSSGRGTAVRLPVGNEAFLRISNQLVNMAWMTIDHIFSNSDAMLYLSVGGERMKQPAWRKEKRLVCPIVNYCSEYEPNSFPAPGHADASCPRIPAPPVAIKSQDTLR
jgi:hypothetical protein